MKDERNRFLRSSVRTGRNKDGGSKSEGSVGLASP